ncbi:MAG: hypothetical protein H7336_00050 [Bacteriovorax sp.]|nr:hypothetical protein [Bacteriovorax sp.]
MFGIVPTTGASFTAETFGAKVVVAVFAGNGILLFVTVSVTLVILACKCDG